MRLKILIGILVAVSMASAIITRYAYDQVSNALDAAMATNARLAAAVEAQR